jgi:hypothetical protein
MLKGYTHVIGLHIEWDYMFVSQSADMETTRTYEVMFVNCYLSEVFIYLYKCRAPRYVILRTETLLL